MFFLYIVLCTQTFVTDGSINYCGAKLCAHTNAHTFCRYPPGPGPSCMGYIESMLSQEDKSRILARFNRRRSEVARGLPGLPTAGDMLKLRWIEELAREAQRWADQCSLPNTPEEHDVCRDLYSISVGQCVASVVGEAPGLRPETMIDMWYMQYRKYKGNVTTYLPPKSVSQYYSDFAQMVWAKSYMVGCGRSKFMINWRGRLRSVERLVCNFAPRGPVPQRALWSQSEPASTCPPRSRPDEDLLTLCTYQHDMDESYDEDNVMTLEEHLILDTLFTIERNMSLDEIGSLDKIYLTKLAVATIDNSVLTPTPSNSMQKRDLDEKKSNLDTGEDDLITEKSPNNKSIYSLINKLSTRKPTFVGRPKAYNLEDLSNVNRHELKNDDKGKETTTEEIDTIYEDCQPDIIINATPVITPIPVNLTLGFVSTSDHDEIKTDKINTFVDTLQEQNIMMATESTVDTEVLDLYINDIVAKLNLSRTINESSIDENIIEEYLSNPETVRELRESLNRMEHKIAAPTSLLGKVRRELRNIQENERPHSSKTKESKLAEVERNKSLERGPMLNMVLKYMPYLKQYEKSIIGDSLSSADRKTYVGFCTFILVVNIL